MPDKLKGLYNDEIIYLNPSQSPEELTGTIAEEIGHYLTTVGNIFFAKQWYAESIKSKSEIRQEILDELAIDRKKIYNENEITILKDNTKIMQLWIKNNPKDAKNFLRFKDGYEASRESK